MIVYSFFTALVLVSSTVGAAYMASKRSQVLREGVIGYLDNLNPLIPSINNVDKDVQSLIFNSLLRINSKGDAISELAETWTISSDGKKYTVYLRKGVRWHDGTEFTSKDVLTTYRLIKEAGAEGLAGDSLNNVLVEAISDYQVEFILPQVNAAFIEILTIPIVSDSIYRSFNYHELLGINEKYIVGTGPYILDKKLMEKCVLKVNKNYFLGKPKLKQIEFFFFRSYKEASLSFITNRIDSISFGLDTEPLVSTGITNYPNVVVEKFTRAYNTKVIYFNLKQSSLFSSKMVRLAILHAIDKDRINNSVYGAGVANGIYSEASWAYSEDTEKYNYDPQKSIEILETEGWKNVKGIRERGGKSFRVSLTYLRNVTNQKIAEITASNLDKVGIKLILRPLEAQEFETAVRERDFELLLFEIQSSYDPDEYTLWHSSQVEHPKLNLGHYKSKRTDGILESARITLDVNKRKEYYSYLDKIFMQEVPVIFLYKPSYYYVRKEYVRKDSITTIAFPSDRFNNIEKWYIDN